MKDSILNSAVIACAFSAFLFVVIDDTRSGPPAAVARVESAVQTKATVVAMTQLPSNVGQTATVAR